MSGIHHRWPMGLPPVAVPDPLISDVLFLYNSSSTLLKDSGPLDNTAVASGTFAFDNSNLVLGFPTYTNVGGGTNRLELASDAFISAALLNGAFCFEGFITPVSQNPADGRVCSFSRFQAAVNTSNEFIVTCTDLAGSSYGLNAGVISYGTTYHFAFVREKPGGNDVLKLYLNGVLKDSATGISPSGNIGNYAGFGWVMGYNSTGSQARFSNWRLTKNQARYLAPFTPPSTPFTGV